MKKVFVIFFHFVLLTTGFSQKKVIDTNYATVAVSPVWVPNGESLLITVIKYHKTAQGYFSKLFSYDIRSKQVTPLFDNSVHVTVSPDGKTIAFLKRDEEKRVDIHVYDMKTKKQSVLYSDSLGKSFLKWSPDGKNLLYNISHKGQDLHATVDICVLNIVTKKVIQITDNENEKAYEPSWAPDGQKIVYFLEKGDRHDQIWLTDLNGSFHTNLTNDTTTHNYFPGWFGEKTILYTQSPGQLMMIETDGTNRRTFNGFHAEQPEYNLKTGLFVYITNHDGNKVIIYDWKKKTSSIVLDGTKMIDKF